MSKREIVRKLFAERPILQSPMAGAQEHEMAVAVNKGGGIGAIPCAMFSPAQVKDEVNQFRAKAGQDATFNLNFFCHEEFPNDTAKTQKWIHTLRKYYRELGMDIDAPRAPAPPRRPFDETSLSLVKELKPPIISFHFGLPKEHLFKQLKRDLPETLIFCSATTPAEMDFLVEHVDALIVQGSEAGGHRGIFLPSSSPPTQFSLFSLLQHKVDVPVVATGGISSNIGISAAKLMGADAVQVGTRLLVTPESRITAVHRAALKNGSSMTSLTNVFTGKPARSIVNRLQLDLGFINTDVVPPFPQAANFIAPLRAAAEKSGKGDFSALWCGQHCERSSWNFNLNSEQIVSMMKEHWNKAGRGHL